MPNYINPYLYNTYPNAAGSAYLSPYQQPMNYSGNMYGAPQGPQYMYSVDGEIAAKAWQVPGNVPLPPNTVIPLWDLDGYHVYFKSTDAYGRMNPLRKGRVVFDDEQENLPNPQEKVSGTPAVDTEKFVTKDDLQSLREEIRNMLMQNPTNRTVQTAQNSANSYSNQNGRKSSGGDVR